MPNSCEIPLFLSVIVILPYKTEVMLYLKNIFSETYLFRSIEAVDTVKCEIFYCNN